MNILSSIADIDLNSKIENVGDIFSFGGQIVLMGMGTIFTVLIIIWLSILGLRFLFANFKPNANKEKKALEPAPQPAVQSDTPSCDGEIIAAITAAIVMAESENTGLKFRVVSFRRK